MKERVSNTGERSAELMKNPLVFDAALPPKEIHDRYKPGDILQRGSVEQKTGAKPGKPYVVRWKDESEFGPPLKNLCPGNERRQRPLSSI